MRQTIIIYGQTVQQNSAHRFYTKRLTKGHGSIMFTTLQRAAAYIRNNKGC